MRVSIDGGPAAPANEVVIQALDELLQPHNRSDAPGLVIGVARHGRLVYRRGLGLASIEHGVANTAWTRMRIGSTSKHFACLAALLLAEDGKLDLDDQVRRHFPELAPNAVEPTLRQLMNHTSGLRCYLDAGFLSDGLAVRPAGSGWAGQLRQRDVNFVAGQRFMYNNGGYHLLSLLIQRLGGMPFEQFLKERIFAPLGMVDTLSLPSDFAIHSNMATLHVKQADGSYKRGIFPSMELLGEGAIASTIDDMLRWLAHLRGPKRVGSDASWEQMLAPTRLGNGVTVPYGLGLMRHQYRGTEVIHHAGAVFGGSCQMLTVPGHALDIVILSNGAQVDVAALAKQVVDAALGDALLEPAPARPELDSFRPLLGKRYMSPSSGFVMGFAEADGRPALSLLNLPPFPLDGDDRHWRLSFEDFAAGPFSIRRPGLAGDAAAPPTLQISESGVEESYHLLPETGPAIGEVGRELAGRYSVPELDAEAVMYVDGAELKMEVKGHLNSTLMSFEPLAADVLGWQMTAAELPLRGIARVQRQDGKVVALRFDTTRTRNLVFERQGG
ncbi:serine hydrolase [Rugamonas sp. FT107W]|uniref:Serine hydrolase n=1 Tax=Duganella vulcania TaxID=2692166 RepID=A0A845HJ83_9BURK|nr:serine hydrolase domain-containing protein [Duganella vulcania]MYN18768.1 serine hydrolase [Duganella vulcania]